MSERTVSPAVYGVETEYSCMLTWPDERTYEIVGSCHSKDAPLGLYEQPADNGNVLLSDVINTALVHQGIIRNTDGMLSNGGRFYVDVSGPEYASPETTTAEDAVLRVFEGDIIVLRLLESLREQGHLSSYQLNRRIVDHNRTSRGIHLNTLTKLNDKKMPEDIIVWLATLNVAKGALFGSGGLLLNSDHITEFHHSPRLSLTTSLSAPGSHFTERPLVRKPFKQDGNCFARIETVTSDALNFGWPMRASLIATNAVMGIIELGLGNKLPSIVEQSAIRSAHNVGLYGADGVMEIYHQDKPVKRRSLDVLRNIVEVILEIDTEEQHLDEESDQVLGEIIEVADKMANDPSTVIGQVESMARRVAMDKKMDSANVSIDSETMCQFDYAWDWLGGGIAERLRTGKKLVGWDGFRKLPTHREREKRLVTPPQNTRAKIRGEAISRQDGTLVDDWHTIDFGDGEEKYIHPLDTKVPKSHPEPHTPKMLYFDSYE